MNGNIEGLQRSASQWLHARTERPEYRLCIYIYKILQGSEKESLDRWNQDSFEPEWWETAHDMKLYHIIC